MRSVCILHAPSDSAAAAELQQFLETGCDVKCFREENRDVVRGASTVGLSGDVLLLLLSSGLGHWPERRVWEPVLVREAQNNAVEVLGLELEPCAYPKVLKPVFLSRRALKRWLWHRDADSRESHEFEDLYRSISDMSGRAELPLARCRRFATEAASEFELTLWVRCAGRTRTQQVSAAGMALGIDLREPAELIRPKVEKKLEKTRALVVFEGLSDPPSFEVRGRSSLLTTPDSDSPAAPADTFASARQLVLAGRLAEAYEAFQGLPQTAACRNEMAWILDARGRTDEANRIHPGGHLFADQQGLFG